MATKKTALAADQLQILDVDPTTLRTTDQIREDATPDEALVESVRTAGILQPPTVVWNDTDGAYYIVFGHRRVGAAIMAGLPQIPVIVRDVDTLTEAIALEDQIIENERREGVTGRELARGWAKLEGLFGLTAEDIAAAVAEKPERVRAGIRAARSEKTTAILEARPTIDLERAAILTEFDEHPKVQFELATVAETRPQDFDWKVRQAQTELAKTARMDELKAELKAKKVKLAKTGSYGDLSTKAARIGQLVDEDGKKITPKRHESCPGHAGHIDKYASVSDLKIEYVCNDYKAHGHQYATSATRPLTEEEKQERAAREAHAAAFHANLEARRQWIHDLLPGKINQLPGVYEYMAAALLQQRHWEFDHRATNYTLPMLDVEAAASERDRADAMDELIASKRVAPFRMMLATALGIHEDRTLTRRHHAFTIRHLTQLQKWGYPLTEIDNELLKEATDALTAADEANADDEDADE